MVFFESQERAAAEVVSNDKRGQTFLFFIIWCLKYRLAWLVLSPKTYKPYCQFSYFQSHFFGYDLHHLIITSDLMKHLICFIQANTKLQFVVCIILLCLILFWISMSCQNGEFRLWQKNNDISALAKKSYFRCWNETLSCNMDWLLKILLNFLGGFEAVGN